MSSLRVGTTDSAALDLEADQALATIVIRGAGFVIGGAATLEVDRALAVDAHRGMLAHMAAGAAVVLFVLEIDADATAGRVRGGAASGTGTVDARGAVRADNPATATIGTVRFVIDAESAAVGLPGEAPGHADAAAALVGVARGTGVAAGAAVVPVRIKTDADAAAVGLPRGAASRSRAAAVRGPGVGAVENLLPVIAAIAVGVRIVGIGPIDTGFIIVEESVAVAVRALGQDGCGPGAGHHGAEQPAGQES